jgi:predicted nucleic acid-binding protein
VDEIIANASPLIAFRQLGQVDLLYTLTGSLLIPPAVHREVFHDWIPPAWITVHSLSQPIAADLLSPRLGAGEREAISLAIELGGSRILLDDLAARRAAEGLGLNVAGTLGLLLQARQQGKLDRLQPALDTLLALNFRISPALYRLLLVRAGEQDKN